MKNSDSEESLAVGCTRFCVRHFPPGAPACTTYPSPRFNTPLLSPAPDLSPLSVQGQCRCPGGPGGGKEAKGGGQCDRGHKKEKRGWVVCDSVGVFFHSHVSVLAIGALLLCYVMSLYFLTTDQWVPSVRSNDTRVMEQD